jgi:hypothetical protein
MTAKRLYPLIIIVILVFGINFNTLFNDFVFDDKFEILQNHWIRDIKYSSEIFSSDSWGFTNRDSYGDSNYYRPLIHIIRMMNYHIFGLVPWGFHSVNIIFHAGISVLVFLIAERLLKRTDNSFFSPPFVAAVLFATHPIHTEQVAWVSSITGLTFAFFYLLSFYLYMRTMAEGRIYKGGYFLSVMSFFLASLSKETALTLPFILVVYDYTFRNSPYRLVDYIKRHLPFFAVAGIYLILRIYALHGFAPDTSQAALTGYQYFINIFPLFAKYLEKLVLPVNLSAVHVLHPAVSIFEAEVMISIAVFLGFTFLVYLSFKKFKTLFLSLILISVPLLPALYLPAVGIHTFAERYLYLPSLGFVMLLALLLKWVQINKQKWAITLTLGFLLLIVVYSFGSMRRNTVWKDDYTLWSDTVRKSPDAYIPHNGLGHAYLARGYVDKAIEHLTRAIKLRSHPGAYINLGIAYQSKGLIDKAIEQYQIAIKLNPDDPGAHINLVQGHILISVSPTSPKASLTGR